MGQEEDKEDRIMEGTGMVLERKGKGRVEEGKRRKDGYVGGVQKEKEEDEGWRWNNKQ